MTAAILCPKGVSEFEGAAFMAVLRLWSIDTLPGRKACQPQLKPQFSSRRNHHVCAASFTTRCTVHWEDFAVSSSSSSLPHHLWVAETSSGNEVVDSAGFVPKLISHVGDCLGALALPVFLAPSQARTGLGEFGPPAPDHGAQPTGAQAQTTGQRPVVLGGLKRMVAKLACRVDPLPTRDGRRLATSRVQDVLAMEVPAARRTTAKG